MPPPPHTHTLQVVLLQYEVTKLVIHLLTIPDGVGSAAFGFKYGNGREVSVSFNASTQVPLPPLTHPVCMCLGAPCPRL